MNLSQITAYARILIAEVSVTASYSTPTEYNAYANEGIKDMCIKGKVYERTKSATFTTGVATYGLPLDYAGVGLRSLLNPGGVTLDGIEPGGLGRLFIVAGKPIYYYISQTPLVLTTRVNDTIYPLGTILVPSTGNGYMYEVTVGGMVGSSPPTYPTDPGTAVVDNNATLMTRELATTGYAVTLVDTPTTAGGGTGTYTITYYALDNGLYVATSSPNFPEDKHHLLSLFVCFRHFTKMKDITKAMAFYSDYAAALGLQPAPPSAQSQGG